MMPVLCPPRRRTFRAQGADDEGPRHPGPPAEEPRVALARRRGVAARDEVRMLIVDDDFLFVDMLPRLLRKSIASPMLTIVTARSPEEAARLMRSERFDVVVSDFDLRAPRTGLDVLRDVDSVAPEAARILLSGHAPHEIPAVPGVYHEFLEKPMRLRELVEPLARALEERLGLPFELSPER